MFNKSGFKSAEQTTIDDVTIFQIESAKERVSHYMPVQGACMIFSNAKLIMLEFVYDFLDRFLDNSDFQIMYTDTDSMWVAYTKD